MEKSDKNKTNETVFQKIAKYLLAFYFIVVLLLFLAELNVPFIRDYFRATDQVLLLLALLILPFVLTGMSKFVRTLTLKISGQELHLELEDIKQNFHKEVKTIENDLSGQVSTSEQAFWPTLAGYDIHSDKRLKNKHIIIGSKEDPSQVLFAHLIAQVIKKYVPNVKCEVKIPNGGSLKNFADLKFKWIDVYIDYTGTCCQYFNIKHHGKTDKTIIDELNEYGNHIGLKWGNPLGASEDYCLVAKKSTLEKYDIETLDDLKIMGPKLVFSADPEFLNRHDCYIGLQNYGIDFKAVKACKVTDRYEYLEGDEADIFVGYETDPEIDSREVVRLKDTHSFFPKYLAIPVINVDALAKIEGLEKALSQLHNIISTQDLVQCVKKLRKFNNSQSEAKELSKAIIENKL